jgi:hypothetical protein
MSMSHKRLSINGRSTVFQTDDVGSNPTSRIIYLGIYFYCKINIYIVNIDKLSFLTY